MLDLIHGSTALAKIAAVLFIILPKFSGPDVAHPSLGRLACGALVLFLLGQFLLTRAGVPDGPQRGLA